MNLNFQNYIFGFYSFEALHHSKKKSIVMLFKSQYKKKSSNYESALKPQMSNYPRLINCNKTINVSTLFKNKKRKLTKREHEHPCSSLYLLCC